MENTFCKYNCAGLNGFYFLFGNSHPELFAESFIDIGIINAISSHETRGTIRNLKAGFVPDTFKAPL